MTYANESAGAATRPDGKRLADSLRRQGTTFLRQIAMPFLLALIAALTVAEITGGSARFDASKQILKVAGCSLAVSAFVSAYGFRRLAFWVAIGPLSLTLILYPWLYHSVRTAASILGGTIGVIVTGMSLAISRENPSPKTGPPAEPRLITLMAWITFVIALFAAVSWAAEREGGGTGVVVNVVVAVVVLGIALGGTLWESLRPLSEEGVPKDPILGAHALFGKIATVGFAVKGVNGFEKLAGHYQLNDLSGMLERFADGVLAGVAVSLSMAFWLGFASRRSSPWTHYVPWVSTLVVLFLLFSPLGLKIEFMAEVVQDLLSSPGSSLIKHPIASFCLWSALASGAYRARQRLLSLKSPGSLEAGTALGHGRGGTQP